MVMERWEKSQAKDWAEYQTKRDNPLGIFSVPSLGSAVRAGEIVARSVTGKCLDIGCGVYPKPSYMMGDIQFFGIDPFFGDRPRVFPFAQAMAESLPFADGYFDCATMMSTIEHFWDVSLALSEARRVLRPNGMLFVWFRARGEDDGHHCFHFSIESLTVYLERAAFRMDSYVTITEDRLMWPPTVLAIARTI